MKALLLLPVLFFWPFSANAQDSVPEFSVDIVSSRSNQFNSASKVDVYARIGYDNLSFLTSPNGFTASYVLSLEATELDENGIRGNVVLKKSWDGNVVVATYAETRSDDKSDLTTQTMELEPGNYVFEFELGDENSTQYFVQEVPVTVRSFDRSVSISDLTLIESFDPDRYSIVPMIGKNVSTADAGFRLFYEIYSDTAKPITVRREVFRTVRDGGIPDVPAWMELDPSDEDVVGAVFSEEEATTLQGGKNQHVVTVPLDDIKAGAYVVRVSLLDADGSLLDSAEKYLVVQWSGLAAHIQDIDEAIQQLEYIAKKKDIDFIRDAPNEVERVQRFESFWDKRDPTPNTKRNESMENYYYRVASANKKYGAVQEGWRTDRGFVFVRYGEPDHVERQPFSFDYEPYEVWTYERIGRRFIFVDKTGFGDYELLVPVWDERSRLY